MSFNQKIITAAIFILIGIPAVMFFLNRNEKPQNDPIIPREEITITVIPGWNLRDVAEYLVKQGIASSTKDVFAFTGEPASNKTIPFPFVNEFLSGKPNLISLEGYIAPETYRVFKDAELKDVLKKLISQRETEFGKLDFSGKDPHRILTMASILEKEARTPEERRMIADILWRRLNINWALQVDSSVHYAVDKTGDVFTTKNERSVDSPWNTYKNPGLSPGPIANPSVDSIEAALAPEKNNYWYFLTGTDGKMYYAKTLDDHNLNRARYIR